MSIKKQIEPLSSDKSVIKIDGVIYFNEYLNGVYHIIAASHTGYRVFYICDDNIKYQDFIFDDMNKGNQFEYFVARIIYANYDSMLDPADLSLEDYNFIEEYFESLREKSFKKNKPRRFWIKNILNHLWKF